MLLDQNKKIQREIIQLEKQDKEEVKKAKIIIKEIGEGETKVKKLIRKLKAHKKTFLVFKMTVKGGRSIYSRLSRKMLEVVFTTGRSMSFFLAGS